MDEDTYKRLIQEPDVLEHTTLNVTLKEVVAQQEFVLASVLQRILNENKIEKPPLPANQYDVRPNYYKVDLPDEDIEHIIDILSDLEASFTSEEGEPTPTSTFYASLIDKWYRLTEGY